MVTFIITPNITHENFSISSFMNICTKKLNNYRSTCILLLYARFGWHLTPLGIEVYINYILIEKFIFPGLSEYSQEASGSKGAPVLSYDERRRLNREEHNRQFTDKLKRSAEHTQTLQGTRI